MAHGDNYEVWIDEGGRVYIEADAELVYSAPTFKDALEDLLLGRRRTYRWCGAPSPTTTGPAGLSRGTIREGARGALSDGFPVSVSRGP